MDGVLVILRRDEGETPAMTSDRATLVAAAVGNGSSRLVIDDMTTIMSECRKAVWSDHCGCVYPFNGPQSCGRAS